MFLINCCFIASIGKAEFQVVWRKKQPLFFVLSSSSPNTSAFGIGWDWMVDSSWSLHATKTKRSVLPPFPTCQAEKPSLVLLCFPELGNQNCWQHLRLACSMHSHRGISILLAFFIPSQQFSLASFAVFITTEHQSCCLTYFYPSSNPQTGVHHCIIQLRSAICIASHLPPARLI